MAAKKCSFLLGFILTTITGVTEAQYRIEREYLTADQGLSQNVVTDIITDHRGYLWIGTRDGLNRYDGFEVTTYAHSPVDSSSLSFNHVTSIFEDTEGEIWVGTQNGLNLYRRASNNFKRFVSNGDAEVEWVYDITQTAEGNLYGLSKNGLFLLDGSNQEVVKKIDGEQLFSNQNDVRDMHLFPRKNDLIAFDNLKRAYWYDSVQNLWQQLNLEIPNQSNILAITRTGETSFLIGDRRDLYEVDIRDLTVKKVDTFPADITTLSLHKGQIIIGFYDMAFYISDDSGEWKRLSDDLVDQNLASTPRVIVSGDKDNVWVGTNGFGLARISPDQARFGLLQYDRNNRSSIMNNSIRSILPLSESEWLIGGYSGLERYHSGKDQVDIVFSRTSESDRRKYGDMIDVVPFELYQDRDNSNTIWIGTEGSGLLRYTLNSGQFESYSVPGSFNQNTVKQIVQLDARRLILGTAEGVFLLQKDDTSVEFIPIKSTEQMNVHAIIEISESKLLLGLNEGGLAVFDWSTLDVQKLDVFDQNGLISVPVNSLLHQTHTDNTIWAGTQIGLMKLSTDLQMDTLFTTNDGLPNSTVYGLLEDVKGNIWMSTNSGISSMNTKRLNFTNYSILDGLQSSEFNRNAFADLNKSLLFFGGINGLNYFRPAEIQKAEISYPVYVHELSANSTSYKVDLTGQTDQQFNFQDNDSEIKLIFSTPVFNNPNSTSYYYRIPQLSDDWLRVPGNSGEILLQNLPANEYEVQLVRSGPENIKSAAITSIELEVIPPFYKRTWIQLLFAIALAGAGWSGYRRKLRRLERDKKLAKEYSQKLMSFHEEERHRIARALHDSVGIDLMMAKMSIEKLNREGENKQISKSVHTLEQTISQIRSISHNLHPHLLANIGLEKTLKNLLEKLSETAPFRLKYTVELSEGLLDTSKELHLYRFIQECLNNSVKHSKADLCVVSISEKNGTIEIEITDDGVGFDLSSEKEKQFGLVSLRERAELIDAELTINSAPKKGTRIHLNISLDS